MKKIFTILLAIALVVKGMAQSTQVKLTSGLAEGAFENGIYTYKGIPYAKADRFTAPQAPDSWLGVRTFTEYGQMSSQASMGFGGQSQQMNMGDDCQNLNVWTPQINDGKKRPVMVWLHGGGFQSGSSQETQTDGTNLSRKGDVVVVSINHRLNVLGFLNLADYINTRAMPVSMTSWSPCSGFSKTLRFSGATLTM